MDDTDKILTAVPEAKPNVSQMSVRQLDVDGRLLSVVIMTLPGFEQAMVMTSEQASNMGLQLVRLGWQAHLENVRMPTPPLNG